MNTVKYGLYNYVESYTYNMHIAGFQYQYSACNYEFARVYM